MLIPPIQRVDPEAESRFPRSDTVMLAHLFTEKVNPTGWWMSEKLDGIRAIWDGKLLLSRNMKPITAPDWFLEQLPPNLSLDGELWLGRNLFQQTSSIVRRQVPDDRWKAITYAVFDSPDTPGTFETRIDAIADIDQPNITILEQEICQSLDHMFQEFRRIRALNGEGLILRAPRSRYERKRSRSMLKVKERETCDAVVLQHVPGKGKHVGRLGALLVQLESGVTCEVGTGFTDAERETPPEIGSVIELLYQGVSTNNVPRFPVFVRQRGD